MHACVVADIVHSRVAQTLVRLGGEYEPAVGVMPLMLPAQMTTGSCDKMGSRWLLDKALAVHDCCVKEVMPEQRAPARLRLQ